MTTAAQPCAPANPAIALRLQSTRPVGRVAELGSFGPRRPEPDVAAPSLRSSGVSARCRGIEAWLTGGFSERKVPDMKVELPLAEMSVADKLHAMEAIWADLCRTAPEEAAPDWHLQILEDRERRLAAGQEEVLDWEEAKRRLRQEIHEGQDS
jgi:hypothetical protein